MIKVIENVEINQAYRELFPVKVFHNYLFEWFFRSECIWMGITSR